MQKEITYNVNVHKGDLIEIYAKTICNLGPLNYLLEKNFQCSINVPDGSGGNVGFCIVGYSSPLFLYIAKELLDTDGSVRNVRMSRGNPFSMESTRKITLEQIADKELKVTIEGSVRGIKKVQSVLDKMYDNSASLEVKKVISDFLARDNI